MEALKKMTNISKLEPRKAFLRKIRDPETREVIDNGLCLWFPGIQYNSIQQSNQSTLFETTNHSLQYYKYYKLTFRILNNTMQL